MMASEQPLPLIAATSVLERIRFRRVAPTDIPRCLELEQASYPPDEAASKSALQYRQHHAAPYFRCAVLLTTAKTPSNHKKNSSAIVSSNSSSGSGSPMENALAVGSSSSSNNSTDNNNNNNNNSNNNNIDDIDDDKALIVGFICGTRCSDFGAASMRPGSHDPNGTVLAIHSVVVAEAYRRQGIAKAMLQDYVQQMEYEERKLRLETTKNGLFDYYYYYSEPRIERLVLLSKQSLLSFYLQCGFAVMRPSDITHGADVWYHCERTIPQYELSYWVVDSFAARSQPGSGNPAAIVLLMDGQKGSSNSSNSSNSGDNDKHLPRSREWMQMVAREFNLSETAFCWPKPQDQLQPLLETESFATLSASNISALTTTTTTTTNNGDRNRAPDEWNILYFTPQVEVALCGHATLAAAHVIASTIVNSKSEGPRPESTMNFHATNDVLKTTVTVDGVHDSIVTMDFPALPPTSCSDNESDYTALAEMMHAAFGIAPADILYIGLAPGLGDVLVEVTKERFFQIGYGGLKLGALEREVSDYTRGVIVCCCDPPASTADSGSDEEPRRSGASTASSNSHSGTAVVDFWSRFFAPKAGIAEDPVTGSAHCILAPYFGTKLNKPRVVGKQMSPRTGVVQCVWKSDDPIVQITGNAVTMMQGSLRF